MIEPNCGGRKSGNALRSKFRKGGVRFPPKTRQSKNARAAFRQPNRAVSRARRLVVARLRIRTAPVLRQRADRIEGRKGDEAADKSADMGLPGDALLES